jgi:hypothetical protein
LTPDFANRDDVPSARDVLIVGVADTTLIDRDTKCRSMVAAYQV